MLRYLGYLVLAIVALSLVTVAMANRQIVDLQLLPEELGQLVGLTFQVQLPLYLVVFGSIATGVLVGFVWEWLREYKHRSEVTKRQRQVKDLKREVIRLKDEKNEGRDEILALLDDTPAKKAG